MIKLVLSSASNFTPELLKKYNLDYLKYEVVFKDNHYLSLLDWSNISKEDFINYMSNNNYVTIAHPPIGEWVSEFNELLKSGQDLACLITTHSLGGACRAFNITKSLINADKNIYLLEANGSGPVEELIALKLVNFIKEDTSFEEIKSYVNFLNNSIHFYAISESMKQWTYTGRSNDKKKDFSYPEGVPVMKGQPDGHIFPLCLCKDFNEGLEKLKEDIKDLKATECVINYTYKTYPEWISTFEKTIVDTLGCKVIAKNIHGQTVTCVEGLNSVDVAFI